VKKMKGERIFRVYGENEAGEKEKETRGIFGL